MNTLRAEQIQTDNRRLSMILILGVLSGLGPLTIDMYLPALPTMTEDLHTTASLTQLTITATLLGIALGQVFVGPFSDRYGRRMPLIISMAVYVIVSLSCMFVGNIELLVALRLVQGISGAAGIVLSRAVVRDLYSGTELTKFFALLMLVNGAAPILAPVIGGMLLEFTTWRGVFFTLFLISTLLLIAVFFRLPETLTPERRARGGLKEIFVTYANLIKDRSFMGFAASQALVMTAMFAYIAGSPFVFQNIFKVSPFGFSMIFAMNGIGIIVSSQIAGRLAGRVPEKKQLFSSLVLAAVASLVLFIMILMGAGLLAVCIPLFFAVSCVGIVNTTSFSLAMEKHGKTAGLAAALLGVLPFIGGAIAAPLVGIAGDYTAVPMGVIMVFCNGAALLTYLLFLRK